MKNLEILLYFAFSMILILGGLVLIFTKIEAIGSSLVAGGIAGIVMYWVTYIQRRKTTEEEKLLEKIKSFGIVDILPRRLTKTEADALFGNRAKKSLDVLGFSLKTFYEDVKDGQLQKVAKKNVKIRLLTVHPENTYCAQRDYEESSLLGTTKNEVIKLTRFVEGLNNPNIEIKWYKSIPTTSFEMIDNEFMVVGPYLVGWQHRNTYSISIRKGALFDYYRIHFNKIWNDPKLSYKPDLTRFVEGNDAKWGE